MNSQTVWVANCVPKQCSPTIFPRTCKQFANPIHKPCQGQRPQQARTSRTASPTTIPPLPLPQPVFKNWKKYVVDWRTLYPHLANMHKDNTSLDLTEDLMALDIGELYKRIEGMDTGRVQFGWIPTMASSSVGQLGALSAESYCERILSCANNVLTKGNTLLSHDELEMIVVLRMNRAFMQFMRAQYAAEAKQVFGQTVVRDE